MKLSYLICFSKSKAGNKQIKHFSLTLWKSSESTRAYVSITYPKLARFFSHREVAIHEHTCSSA